MTTVTNETGSKAVNISTSATGSIIAMYVQIYNGEQQVLQSKAFSKIAAAKRWADKILK